MLTEDETRVMAHAYALRQDEQPGRDLWFCPDDGLLPECVCLVERGYLQRRWHGDDMVYRLSDAMFTAQGSRISLRAPRAGRTDERDPAL